MGAGRPGWHRQTYTMRCVDVRRLAREKLLYDGASFSWEWKDPDTGEKQSSIWMQVAGGAVQFSYTLTQDKQDVRDAARLTTTGCNYGGLRHWFSCPCCGRRCAVLYLGKRVACRKCYRLKYPSQSDDATGKLWRKKRRLAARIGSDGTDWEWTQKPRGMHQATFQRIRGELAEMDSGLNALLCAAAARLLGHPL